MPELPEIESLKLTLEPHIKGRTIRDVVVKQNKLRFPLPRGFASSLAGAKVVSLSRRGKILLVLLEQPQGARLVLLIHLGMSGRLLFCPTYAHKKHDHVLFHFSSARADDVLVFNDPRRFGFIDRVAVDELASHPRLRQLGAEPLEGWRHEDLRASLASRKASIKAVLLNQKVVAGLGNIYVCEALFAATIAPDRPARTLSASEVKRLHGALLRQLTLAIAAGGATISDYLNANGKKGSFQHQFRVYDKAGEPCPRKGCAARVSRLVQSGTFNFLLRRLPEIAIVPLWQIRNQRRKWCAKLRAAPKLIVTAVLK